MRPCRFQKVTLEYVAGDKTVAEQSVFPHEEPFLFNVATRLRAGRTFDHPTTGRRHVVLAMIVDLETETLVVKIDGADFTAMRPCRFQKVTLEYVAGDKTVAEQSVFPHEEPFLFNVATRLRAGRTFDHPTTGRRHVVLAMIVDLETETLVVKIDGADFTSSDVDEIGNMRPDTVVETTLAFRRLKVLGRSGDPEKVRCLDLTTNREMELSPGLPVYKVLSPS